jgi:AraC family transcriptional regulator
MESKIIERDRMLLVGFSFFGDPFAESGGWTEENEIGRLWQRFTAYVTAHGERIPHVVEEDVAYEVHVESEETATKGYREVFVGTEVVRLDDVPVELLVKILPATTYAVFTLHGEEIVSDWSQALDAWMRETGYTSAYPYGVQRYDDRFKGLDGDALAASELDVYIPIQPT